MRVALASRLRPVWPCIHEMSLWLARRLPGGADAAIGMNKGGTVEAAGMRVTMTGADHSAGDWNPGGETTLYLGEPGRLRHRARERLPDLPRRRHGRSSATCALIRELHRPDLAMLPIGGHFTMDPTGAALAVELLGVKDVMPLHYGTFPILAGTPEELRVAAGRPRPRRRRGPRAGPRRVDRVRAEAQGAGGRVRDGDERHRVDPRRDVRPPEVDLDGRVRIRDGGDELEREDRPGRGHRDGSPGQIRRARAGRRDAHRISRSLAARTAIDTV